MSWGGVGDGVLLLLCEDGVVDVCWMIVCCVGNVV